MQDNQENSLGGGMLQDVAKSKIPPDKYYKALNFRLTTDKGLSSGALTNIQGNKNLIEIPDTSEVKKIEINYSALGATFITITNGAVVGVSSIPIEITSGTTPLDIYNHLNDDPGFNAVKALYKLFYNATFLLFYGIDINATFTITDTNGAVSVTNDYIPEQTDLEIIGSTFINDTIYLLTTNNTSKSPGKDDSPSYGQIWKLEIEDVLNTATISLIYNNQLNFSTYNAFSPTSILGRYENVNIQRIYFTDFFNKIRTLNVANPQAFATNLDLLYITPSIKLDVPILKKLSTGGTNLVGSYQLAYRLTKVSGAISAYSEPSDLVNLVATDENLAVGGNNFVNYIGESAGTSANKIITWQINNLDTSFDRIELVIIVRYTNTIFPNTIIDVLAQFDDLPIDADGSMTVTFSGNETLIPVTINNFLLTNQDFSYCKTLTTKDNRLIIGNVKGSMSSIDNFDARAYRSKTINSEDIYLTNNGLETQYNLTDLYDSTLNPENKDNINNYSSVNAGKYKPNTTILGGQGEFISYEFGTYSTMCDYENSFVDFQGVPGLRHTFFNSPNTINLGIAGQDHDQNSINDSLKYAYKANLLKGYQRDEIYRFAIQLYDKSGNPYFVKWIGDIKFPSYFDNNNNSDTIAQANGINDFRLIFFDATGSPNKYFLQQLYIKFKIELPDDLAAVIGYYNIVRVERGNSDKTIFGSGLIFPTLYVSGEGAYYIGDDVPVAENRLTNASAFDAVTLQFPEFLFGGYYPGYNASDTLKIEANVVCTNGTPVEFKPDATPTGGGFGVFKLYDFQPNSNPGTRTLLGTQLVGTAGSVTVAPFDFKNYQSFSDGAQYVGTDTVFALVSGGPFDDTDYLADNERQYFGTYRRILDKQYGGNNYSQRANNTYISCNNVQIVNSGAQIFESKVFGGDTFITLMDNEKAIRNIGTDGITQPASNPIFSKIYLFACESSINTELRFGGHANKDLVDSSATAWDYHEDYFYNPAFKNENNIKKYFPKPDPFLQNDEFINRFYASEIKINGELTDSWSQFKSLNYYDVEGSFGPINGVSMLQDEVYFIQDKAFGKLNINPKEVITTKEGSSVGLGRGGVLDSHEYISTEIGSKHQFSFIKTPYQLFFVDSRNKKIYSFSQNKPLVPESDIKGMHSWLINHFSGRIENIDKPVYNDADFGINGVHGVYDSVNNELIYTFLRTIPNGLGLLVDKNTIVINPNLEIFTGFYSHTPKIYVTNNKKFISSDFNNDVDLNVLFLHNYGNYGKFYEQFVNSEIEIFVNKTPEITKIFDNIMFESEMQDGNTLIDTDSGVTPIHETFNSLEVSTDYQTSGIITLNSTNMNRNYRTWRTTVPRSDVQAPYVSAGLFARIRDKYMKLKLSFINNGNKRLILHNIITYFRLNQPK